MAALYRDEEIIIPFYRRVSMTLVERELGQNVELKIRQPLNTPPHQLSYNHMGTSFLTFQDKMIFKTRPVDWTRSKISWDLRHFTES